MGVPIHVGMMKVEQRITRRRVDILNRPQLTTHTYMSRAMVCELLILHPTLHTLIKLLEVACRERSLDLLGGEFAVQQLRYEIATKTVLSRLNVLAGADVDDHIFERTILHASTTGTTRRGHAGVRIGVLLEVAVATETGLGVPNGGVEDAVGAVGGVAGPIPVGLSAFVAAEVAEVLFVGGKEVAVL